MSSSFASNAYLQSPEIYQDQIFFLTDDDLWKVNLSDSQSEMMATRVTNSRGAAAHPKVSPSGKFLAYTASDQGQRDIYISSLYGESPKRITYSGVVALVGWLDEETLIYKSNTETFSPRVTFLYTINIKNFEVKDLNLGHASTVAYANGLSVLGRNNGDPARWKRYRGGTAGTLWVDKKGKGDFKQILKDLKSNLACPAWIPVKGRKSPRLFFISDHEGTGNIYSCNDLGKDIKRHTHHSEYYVRSFSYHDGRIVFQAGGELYLLDLESDAVKVLSIRVPSSFNQADPRLEDSEHFLQEFFPNKDGTEIAFITRGQLFLRSPWNGAPLHLGDSSKRYKSPLFITLNKQDAVVVVELNEENEETLKLFTFEKEEYKTPKALVPKQDWGKIQSMTFNPHKELIAITTNRNYLYLVDLKGNKVQEIGHNPYGYFSGVTWSPCGQFLAYNTASRTQRSVQEISLYDLKKKEARLLIPSVLLDSNPTFDPSGEYLYFIGVREFHPNYAESHFELSFPFASKVYAVSLQKENISPLELYDNFEPAEENEDDAKENKENKSKKVETKKEKKKEDPEPTRIDWEGIESRILPLPLPMGGYKEVVAIEDKLFIAKSPIKGQNPFGHWREAEQQNLYTYCLKEKKLEAFQKNCDSFEVTASGKYILLDTEDGLRLVSTEGKPTEGEDCNKKDGYLDLDNLRLFIDPKKEWAQMYQEAWILQREHFWSEDMNKVDWQQVYLRYLPLLDKVHTRLEFSDLIWEMQGELGTSHCYEFGGDYNRRPPSHPSTSLGATLKWNSRSHSYTIIDMPMGDSWIPQASSPLRVPGVQLKEGDSIIGIDGKNFKEATDLEKALTGRNQQKTLLQIKRKGAKEAEYVEVTPRYSYHNARYRDWVNKNKEYVHKKTNGKVGYVHIPDMGVAGFSEFYRNYLSECSKEGMIVDVRYNGGGHISQHILKILAQKTIGFDQTRYMDVEPYPMYAVNGPIVGLTNEHAGSDGDIFSHSFKLMGIGPLLGVRTWGGVVGIWPRHGLNDGTLTTQPEFSFWFKDVGYDVENYGTDPDIEVENTPAHWRDGVDHQLDRSIAEVMKLKKKHPSLKPNLKKGRPNLKAPKLPKAKN